ncbi:MAG: SGNH/GDSL hydrolase family protein [Bacteroidetes bacterium]|nr:SGNH/GDSL hydrolase family protein [Bacteroidota bacterium]
MSRPPLRCLALGDSYTIGEGVAENQRWPVQLATRLRTQDIPLANPEIIAMTGWTTDELAVGIDKAHLLGPYDFVSLLIGVNNQYRGRSLEEYQQQFRGLLQRAIAFGAGDASRVLVVSIPDWSVTPFANRRDCAAIAAEIDVFNAANREETERTNAGYLDITPLSSAQGKMVVKDGLHPNGKAYAAWAELALPIAHAMLRSTGGSS